MSKLNGPSSLPFRFRLTVNASSSRSPRSPQPQPLSASRMLICRRSAISLQVVNELEVLADRQRALCFFVIVAVHLLSLLVGCHRHSKRDQRVVQLLDVDGAIPIPVELTESRYGIHQTRKLAHVELPVLISVKAQQHLT